MSAFFKTLFGDANNVAVVAVIMVAEVLLVATGQTASAAFTIPPLVLAGAAWLVKR